MHGDALANLTDMMSFRVFSDQNVPQVVGISPSASRGLVSCRMFPSSVSRSTRDHSLPPLMACWCWEQSVLVLLELANHLLRACLFLDSFLHKAGLTRPSCLD